MTWFFKLLATFVIGLIAFLSLPQSIAYALPSGLSKSQISANLNYPTGFEIAPDGRIFVLEKGGAVRVVRDQQLLPTPFLSLPVESSGERGLLGIALDPGFRTNGFFYLYYTSANPPQERISRFTAQGDQADPGSERILFRTQGPLATFHQGGTVRFGQDGKLWASIGNNGNNANSQDLSNPYGKIIRINPDGTIPSDNPFFGQSGKSQEIWAYGFRNPFRFDFLFDGRTPIVGDVGEASFEEVDIAHIGGNFGWPFSEGFCTSCPYINPIFAYSHNGHSASITGGFIYRNQGDHPLPSSYNGSYFYGDYAQGFIHNITFDANGNFVSDSGFDAAAGSVVDLKEGLDGALYFITIANQSFSPGSGVLYKIARVTENQPPVAKITASVNGGSAPLTVSFSSEGSFDPEGQSLSYVWDFGDGTGSSQTNPSHTYTANGTYTARLVVSDSSLQSQPVTTTIIVGNHPPQVSIDTPIPNTHYNAGQTITYSGSATDAEDGNLPAGSYSWEVIFHHGTHVHPFLGPLVGATSGSFTIPDNGESSADSSYEIRLTAVDSSGLQTIVSRSILPNVVSLTFNSTPAQGLQFTIDGIPSTTPLTISAVVGFKRSLDVPSPQTLGQNGYDFVSWSDNGAKSHLLTTPSSDTTYTISFSQFQAGLGSIRYRVREFDQNGVFTGNFVNGATAKLTDSSGLIVYQTTTSQRINEQDGWAQFNTVEAGTYGVMTYLSGYTGFWKQTTCEGQGTSDNATIQNRNTQSLVALWQQNVNVTAAQITWCKDAGLKAAVQVGNLALKVWLVGASTQTSSGYGPVTGIDNATVKITDTAGTAVLQSATSRRNASGDSGWVFFSNVAVGTYGVMAFKQGYEGFWRQLDCSLAQEINATIQNQNTNGLIGAWNNNVPISSGTTTYCRDLGLRGIGDIRLRIREFDQNGLFTGQFINGVTALLTDTSGNTVFRTTTSATTNGQDGWVIFNHTDVGTYAAIAYKQGLSGYWKQTDCQGAGTTANATVQNQNTNGTVAGWQNSLSVNPGQITWCTDIGLQNATVVSQKGHIRFRVRQFDGNGNFTGNFINGATVLLTDPSGTTVLDRTTSAPIGNEDGWVRFSFVNAGAYGIITYKEGLSGFWKQTDCGSGGTTTDATIQNQNTGAAIAGWQNNVGVASNQITYCKDVGLKNENGGNLRFRVREFSAQGGFSGNFINGATARLMDASGNSVVATQTSSQKNGQDGWVIFDNVSPATYSVVVFFNGYIGFWKQTDCQGAGTTANATVQNQNTNNLIAALQDTIAVTNGQTAYCKDVGLKHNGNIYFRVRDFDADGNFTGNFINDATAKLTDAAGNQVVATVNSASLNGQDGWVHFDNISSGSYGMLVFKSGRVGFWKQTDCSNIGTSQNATIQNQNTENLVAAWQQPVAVTAGQITWCMDVGLK